MKPPNQTRLTILGCALGVAMGAFAVDTLHDVDERAAFDRGYAQGVQDCKEPSKLEKAAKWLAE